MSLNRIASYTDLCRKEEWELEKKHKKEVIEAAITYRKELLSLYNKREPDLIAIQDKKMEQKKRYGDLLLGQEIEMTNTLYRCISKYVI